MSVPPRQKELRSAPARGAEPQGKPRRSVGGAACWCAIFAIRFYQAFIRPHLIGQCKFRPTCSEYGIACLQHHGLRRGGWLTLRRLARCHPFSRGGMDPVPPSIYK